MPGAADGAGGGAATIGYDARTRLTPLTVAFHEAQFIGVAGGENRELLQFGPPALWDGKVRQEHNIPLGPANPQALNRFAYCLGNPLRYVDPTGHYLINYVDIELTASETKLLIDEITWWLEQADRAETIVIGMDFALWAAGILELLKKGAPEIVTAVPVTLLAPEVSFALAGAGLCTAGFVTWTKNDLEDLRFALAMASKGGTERVRLTVGTDVGRWGVKVNGEEVFGHMDLTIVPWGGAFLFSPRGTLNGTRHWLVVWTLWLKYYERPWMAQYER